VAAAGRQQREVTHNDDRRKADSQASRTDPDATVLRRKGYPTHDAIDGGQARIILVPPAEVLENRPALDLVWQTCCQLGYTSASPMMGRGVVCRAGR